MIPFTENISHKLFLLFNWSNARKVQKKSTQKDTQRILSNQNKSKLYCTKQNSVCFQINRKMIYNLISVLFPKIFQQYIES